MASSDKWIKIGNTGEHVSLNTVQVKANQGVPVIAVSIGASHVHVAIIISGTLSPSGKLRLNVPNSVSFFLDDFPRSYVSKKLSFPWTTSKKNTV